MSTPEFNVSVAIPVFNAERFIRRAVERVLMQDEVVEVVIVEDGSKDNSLAVCKELESEHPQVKVFQHENGVNRGCAASRNAAVKHAMQEYIAFADADNLYLPDRFKLDREIFLSDPTIDGVYHAQGIHYEDEAARESFEKCNLTGGEFLSVTGPVPPEEFLSVMLSRHATEKVIGGLGIDAITLRRRCFDKAGFFNTELRLQQDTHFFIKLASTCRMAPGNLETAVALRGVHGEMRSTDTDKQVRYQRMRWELLNDWFQKNVDSAEYRALFAKTYADFKIRDASGIRPIWEFFKTSLGNPGECFQEYGRFDVNYLDVFGKGRVSIRLLSAKNRLVRAVTRA